MQNPVEIDVQVAIQRKITTVLFREKSNRIAWNGANYSPERVWKKREKNKIKFKNFREIREIRHFQPHYENPLEKLTALRDSRLKVFPNNGGMDGFRGFRGNFSI